MRQRRFELRSQAFSELLLGSPNTNHYTIDANSPARIRTWVTRSRVSYDCPATPQGFIFSMTTIFINLTLFNNHMNKITILIVAFLVIGGYMIVADKGYNLKENSGDRKGFLEDFSGWVVNLGKNTKEVVDVAREQDWLPEDYEEYTANDTVK